MPRGSRRPRPHLSTSHLHGQESTSYASVLISVSAFEELEHLGLIAEGDSGGTSDGLNGVDVASETGSVSLVSSSFDTGTANAGTSAHDTGVDAARDAVLLLNVDLGQVESVGGVRGVLFDISSRRSVNHLSHLEALDGLVLGHTAGAVDASDHVRMTLVLLPSSVVPSL